jgi:outer membrane protein assembly factor BamB
VSDELDISVETAEKNGVSRRNFVVATGAAAAAAGLLGLRLVGPANAQEGETQVPATPVALGPTIPPEIADNPGDWVVEGKDLSQSRNATSNIDSSTVADLGEAWRVEVTGISGFGSITSNPIVIGDTLYLQDMLSNVYAFAKETGELKWQTDFNLDSVGPNGVAVGYGVVAIGLGGMGQAAALNAETGELLWQTPLTANIGEGIDMAPLIYDNTVYISTVPGNSNNFYRGGQKGIFYALDISSGHVIWQWETVGNLWDNARVNSGGGLWHPPAVDDEGMLYLSVANAAPYPGNSEFPNATSRLGNNDYANSLVKIDPATASVQWYINIKPHDLFDLDNHLSPVLTTVTIDDVEVKLALSSGKHGIVIAADQASGQEIWRRNVGLHQNDTLQEVPEGEQILVAPGTLGGVETPFAVADGRAFFPVLNAPTLYSSTELIEADYTGGKGQLVALDVTSGDLLWEVDLPGPIFSGATVTNDLVWVVGLDAMVRAYNVEDGTLVRSFQTANGANGPMAAVDDYLFVPAAALFVPTADSTVQNAETGNYLVAYKLGAAAIEDPAEKPADEATPSA